MQPKSVPVHSHLTPLITLQFQCMYAIFHGCVCLAPQENHIPPTSDGYLATSESQWLQLNLLTAPAIAPNVSKLSWATIKY